MTKVEAKKEYAALETQSELVDVRYDKIDNDRDIAQTSIDDTHDEIKGAVWQIKQWTREVEKNQIKVIEANKELKRLEMEGKAIEARLRVLERDYNL